MATKRNLKVRRGLLWPSGSAYRDGTYGAAPRLVFAASKKKDEDGEETDARVFVRVKSNIGPDGGALVYALQTAELPDGISTSRVTWSGKIEGTARDILADAEQIEADDGERTERDEACEFLRSLLGDKSVKAAVVMREGREAGHSERTIRRAKDELGIKAVKEGMDGAWVWQLPKMANHNPHWPSSKVATKHEDVHIKMVDAFGTGGHLREANTLTTTLDGYSETSGSHRDIETF